jgi:hypothetical protein
MIGRAPESDNCMSYDEAVLYCRFCNHGGYNNWRLPTKDDYFTLRPRLSELTWYEGRQHNLDRLVRLYAQPVRDIC